MMIPSAAASSVREGCWGICEGRFFLKLSGDFAILVHLESRGYQVGSVNVAFEFEWDSRKAALNLAKHGVSFEEATSAFGDPNSLTVDDPDHSLGENRYVLMGLTVMARLVVVVFSESGDKERIISCRKATKTEARQYVESRK